MPSASELVSTAVCFLYIIGETIHFLVNPYYQVLASMLSVCLVYLMIYYNHRYLHLFKVDAFGYT